MLALSRRKGEAIVLDNDVRIVVVKISGNRVILGVEAPGYVTILREELMNEQQSCLISSST
jgi:carbon storage regulator